MSDRFFETPETNVNRAALKLLRHKMLVEVGRGRSYPSLDVDDINEVLIVAGMPVVMPDEIKAKKVDVIKVDKEVEHDNTDKYNII